MTFKNLFSIGTSKTDQRNFLCSMGKGVSCIVELMAHLNPEAVRSVRKTSGKIVGFSSGRLQCAVFRIISEVSTFVTTTVFIQRNPLISNSTSVIKLFSTKSLSRFVQTNSVHKTGSFPLELPQNFRIQRDKRKSVKRKYEIKAKR